MIDKQPLIKREQYNLVLKVIVSDKDNLYCLSIFWEGYFADGGVKLATL